VDREGERHPSNKKEGKGRKLRSEEQKEENQK